MRVFRVFSLLRSGHHAVINWMMKQLEGKCQFINNILSPASFNYENFPAVDPAADVLIYNVEDYSLPEALHSLSLLPADFRRQTMPCKDIIVIRDPYNQLASRIKAAQSKLFNPYCLRLWPHDIFLRVWREYAMECLRRTTILDDPIVVNFNLWFSSREYRRKLSEQIGFPFTDQGLDEVPDFGHGSSFSGRLYHNNAQEMPVLKRHALLDALNIYLGRETKELAQMFDFQLPFLN